MYIFCNTDVFLSPKTVLSLFLLWLSKEEQSFTVSLFNCRFSIIFSYITFNYLFIFYNTVVSLSTCWKSWATILIKQVNRAVGNMPLKSKKIDLIYWVTVFLHVINNINKALLQGQTPDVPVREVSKETLKASIQFTEYTEVN